MNKPARYLNSPLPAFHRDLDAAHHRAVATKHQCYHRRRLVEAKAQRRAVVLTLILLTLLAVLVSELCRLMP